MAINRTSPKKGKVVDIPTVPTVGTATAGAESATVALTAATIGGPATTFTAISNPGSVTGTGSSSPVTVSGLTAGTAYTFTVRGNNATGSSEYSSASNSITPTVGTSYESIQTVTGNGSSGTLSFTSIPSTFKHLQLRWFVKNTGSGSTQYIFPIRFNNDSAANYSAHYINANGSTVAASGNANMTGINFYFDFPANVSNTFGVAIMDILDYQNTNKFKTTRSLNGYDANGSGQVAFNSGNYRSTSAIDRIDISFNADAFATGSSIALYGIRG